MSHSFAASSGVSSFFFSRSFNAALSRTASANSRFSLVFSASSARNRFASLTSSPPYWRKTKSPDQSLQHEGKLLEHD
jgi:hypothetical protein